MNEPFFVLEGARAMVLVVIAGLALVGALAVMVRAHAFWRRSDDAHLRTLAERQLDWTARRAEREQLFAALLDEVRTPLGLLQRRVEELALRCRDCEHASAIQEAGRETDRLWHLSTRIAELVEAASAAEKRVHSDLTEAALAAIDRVRPAAGARGIVFTLDAPGPVPCHLSLETVRDAIAELLENAVRASIAGGHVQLRVRSAGGVARAEVLDFGPGIPAEHQEAIFDPLARHARGRLGGGLGLAIARETARAHGGNVYVAPGGDAGARVVLELPSA